MTEGVERGLHIAARIERDRGGSLAIGTVLGRAFGVMTGNPAPVFGIAFLFGALPPQLVGYFLPAQASDDPRVILGSATIYIGYFIVFVLCSALAQGALVRVTSAHIEGRNADIGECLATGIAKALPVIGLSILLVLGVGIGFMLLFVPGIILALMWVVATPALVEENVSIFGAFGRSRQLSKGVRWQILFLMIVTLVISWLVVAIATVPTLILGFRAAGQSASVGGVIVSLITSTVTSALWSTVITSLYFSLRDRLDGPRTEALADVFA